MNGASVVADVLVVCGPTAAGKSAVALDLAKEFDATIVSADSRQIYRRFDIGTAKPTRAEQAAVPHRGVDIIDATARYSAAAWASDADGWIDASIAAGRRPIVVGGTGLYLRALFEGLFEEPPLEAAERGRFERTFADVSVDELRRWTRALDPARSHLGRTQLLRSIEIALLTGRRLSDLHRERPRVPRWRPHYLVVDPGPALAERIGRRIDRMLDEGWADEVRDLMQTIPADAPAWNATGYGIVRRMVLGELSRAEARERVLIDTRQYAKRQRTWFRHQLPDADVTRVDPSAPDARDTIARWAAA